MPQGIYAQKHPHAPPFDNARLTKLFWVQNNLTLSLQHWTWNPEKHNEMAIVTWFRVSSLNFPMLDSGLCCQVDFRNLTIEHESTPFRTPEMISVGSPFLEARSTSSILQSFGPAVVSNNCSFSGQNITTILTYKKLHYNKNTSVAAFPENCSYGGMASSTSISIYLWKPKWIFQSAPCTCMECQFTPKTALGCCNLGDFSMWTHVSPVWLQ